MFTQVHFLVHLLSVVSDDAQQVESSQWEHFLMLQFFSDMFDEDLKDLSGNTYAGNQSDFCNGSWRGITCTDGKRVTDIRFRSLAPKGQFRLDMLPPTMTCLWIFSCEQKYRLETRRLPRCLRTLSLSSNKYFGHLDLSTLPRQLVSVFLWKNEFTGPIDLTCLPPTLKSLEIHDNKISQKIVWYENLPKEVNSIRLQSASKKQVKRVCARGVSEKADPKIFPFVPEKDIE